ncbi:hypothetical protein CPter91_2865 [Collimonas pratensis]|uniref:Uncharacterized protein n=1 Tax=Collimonas pratensis TaxID=279113 RepID=A0A127Q5B6_9BURK|nr:hypothetical protein CPter91_2865 [Collimonas pratensis]
MKSSPFCQQLFVLFTVKIADASLATLHILCIRRQDKDRAAG